MASTIKVDTIQSTTSNVFFQNSAGTEYARFDSSGNLGIGTSSPSAPATIKGRSVDGQAIRLLPPAATSTFTAIQWTDDPVTQEYSAILGDTSKNLIFRSGAIERMRIDSSGNVGIGTDSPTYGTLEVAQGNAGVVSVINNTAGAWAFRKVRSDGSNGMGIYDATGFGVPAFYAAGSERMRIDSAGEVIIGNTTASQTMDGLFVRGKRTATSNQWNLLIYTQGGSFTFGCRDDYYVRSPGIYDRTAGSAANVTMDASGYLYRSTSSIKYKHDVVNYDKGISTVTQLRPVYYKSKVNDPDGNPVDTQYAGLIAEELDELGLDEFVVKDKDGEVESIHYGNMVALLTKAIQEQQALITQLQADVAALKAK